MAGRLQRRVVFITGTTRAGKSHAVRFPDEDANVIGVDI
jgi:hypothetical protein